MRLRTLNPDDKTDRCKHLVRRRDVYICLCMSLWTLISHSSEQNCSGISDNETHSAISAVKDCLKWDDWILLHEKVVSEWEDVMINKLRTDHAKEYSSCLNFCYSLIPFDPSVTMQLLNVFFWIFLNNIFSSLSIKSKLSLQCMSKLNLSKFTSSSLKCNIDSNDLFGVARVWILIKRREMQRILNFKKTLYRTLGKFNGNVIDLFGS